MRSQHWSGKEFRTAFVKTPVDGPVWVSSSGAEGDEREHRRGGEPDYALYAYAEEDYEWWADQDPPAALQGAPDLGENLTIRGVDVSHAEVGERWRIGDVLVEIRKPRSPCYKLAARMGDDGFIRRFADAARPGALLRILEEGGVVVGDPVEVLERPGHGVSVADLLAFRWGAKELGDHLLSAPQLPREYREAALGRTGT